MFNDVLTLIEEKKSVNRYGDTDVTTYEKDVFVTLKSIGQAEFYQAQAVGLKPEIKFVLADYLDYNGQKKVRYKTYGSTEAEEYTVLRTYRDGVKLELTCKRGVD